MTVTGAKSGVAKIAKPRHQIRLRPDRYWSMPIDHPYSVFVVQEGAGFSGGQCPLDAAGAVVAPHSLDDQLAHVATGIRPILADAGLDYSSISKTVIYYVAASRSEPESSEREWHRRLSLPDGSLVVPVPIPHMYYQGMTFEAEYYCKASSISADDLRYLVCPFNLSLAREDAAPLAAAGLLRRLEANHLPEECLAKVTLYADEGIRLYRDELVRAVEERFAAPRPVISVVTTPAHDNGLRMLADLITVPARRRSELSPPLDRARHAIQIGQWVFTDSIRARAAGHNLLAQTKAVMEALGSILEDTQLSFSQVAKTNAFYVGKASAEELHDNMSIRSSFYAKPGPVSTGIPVLGLGEPGALMAVELCLVVPQTD
jgi:enamine deaminase RidA (YjgF/YER057c/UK114 family)